MKPSKSAAVKNAEIIKKFIDDSQFVYEVLNKTSVTKLDFHSKPAYSIIRFSSAGGVSCCMDDLFVTRDEARPVYLFWYNIYKPMLTFISLKEVMKLLGCASKYDPDGMAIKIYIGYCHQGDEDGGCDCYDYVCDGYWFERGNLPRKLRSDELSTVFNDQNSFEYSEDDYKKDWSALCHMISKSFGKAVKPDYESTNCYYYRYYIVTRDYKICSFVCRSDLADCDLCELADMSTLSEDAAEHAEDQQKLTQIQELASQIHSVFCSIKDESFKEKARQVVADLTK